MPRDVVDNATRRHNLKSQFSNISWGSMPRDVISKYYQRAPIEVEIFKYFLGEYAKRCDL